MHATEGIPTVGELVGALVTVAFVDEFVVAVGSLPH